MAITEKKDLLRCYETMLRIRAFDETALSLFTNGTIKGGTTHPYVGEEAVATGVCYNLRKEDFVSSNHRGHGHCIAKGGEPKYMMAELFGKSTGYCKGRGGSLHIANIDFGIIGANGIVGAGISLAAGAALAAKYRGTDQVAVCFFGDGASCEGNFHETMNMAAIWNLPVIFVCENNLYAMSIPYEQNMKVHQISQRAVAYGIEGITVDGNDLFAVEKRAGDAIEKARKGGGPTLLECVTYRWHGHSKSDQLRAYRTREEEQWWMENCPVKKLEDYLLHNKIADKIELETIRQKIAQEMEEAVKFAKESPELPVDAVFEDLYA